MVEMVNFISKCYVEPLVAMVYVWFMWIIKRSKNEEFRSPFYCFFILSGAAGCMNIFLIALKNLGDVYFPQFELKDLVFNSIIYGSHCFSLSHTIGKTLVIGTRFTAICFPLKAEIWTRVRVRIIAIVMFLLPAILYAFMIPRTPIYRPDAEGVLVYIGVDVWAQQISKLMSASSCLIFVILSIPMCALSMYHLRQAQRFNAELVKQERALFIYTIIMATVHLLKSAQQIFWFVTLSLKNDALFDLATTLYNIGNAATTFLPPILLLFTSSIVRYEMSFGYCGRAAHVPKRTATVMDSRYSVNTLHLA